MLKRWLSERRIQKIESQIESAALLARTCDKCAATIEDYDSARYCETCDRYFCLRCTGLGHGWCPVCGRACGSNPKVQALLEKRDLLAAQRDGTQPAATFEAREEASRRGGKWASAAAASGKWEALLECLLQDPGVLPDFTVKRAYLEAQQSSAERQLEIAVTGRDQPDKAARAASLVLELCKQHPSNMRVAKVAIHLAGVIILSTPEPLRALSLEAGSTVRRFHAQGLYASSEPLGLDWFLRHVK